MLVRICELDLLIYDSNSLKEKRQVINSLIGRIKSRYNVSIAEVGEQDTWNKSIIGISVVSNNGIMIDKIVTSVINFVDNDHRVEIINKKLEIL